MQPQFPINPLELIMVLFLSGGAGLPTSMPPAAEDPLITKVAPADCLAFMMWAGSGEASASSKNQTEQLLAEPEVQAFLKQANGRLLEAMQAGSRNNPDPNAKRASEAGFKLLKLAMSRPTAVYLGDLQMTPGKPPKIQGGLVINLGSTTDEFRQALSELEKGSPVKLESVTIGNTAFTKIQPDPTAPEFVYGIRGKYLIAGTGTAEVEALQTRARGAVPMWLSDLRAKQPVPRLSSLLYINTKKLIPLAVKQSPNPQVEPTIKALGLYGVSSIAAVSGLDETGVMTRVAVGIDGQPTGLLSFAAAFPLSISDLKKVPEKAPMALALRLDAGKVFDTWMGIVAQIDPKNAQQMQAGMAAAQQQLGLNIRDDLLKAMGDTWLVYAHPTAGGILSGWTVSISLRDRQRFEQAHNKLMALASAMAAQQGGPPGAPGAPGRPGVPPGGPGRPGAVPGPPGGPGRPAGPQIQQIMLAGRTAFTIPVPAAIPGVQIAPTWCVGDKEFVFSLSPKAVETALAPNASGPSLADRPEVASLFQNGRQPLFVSLSDERQFFRTLMPFASLMTQSAADQTKGPPPAQLPSADTIGKHLQFSVTSLSRTSNGLELVSRKTLPGGSISSAPAMVALLLPAVQAARSAARRVQDANNLKQIGLAIHNFHDTYRALPGAYNVDASGKPLLSWRVHILPFVEQEPLYRQFHLNEPWDSDHNKQLIARMPALYRSPNSVAEPGKTNYLGVSGAKGVIVAPTSPTSANQPPTGARFADILDGTSGTVMVLEVNDQRAVPWTKPDDFSGDDPEPLKGLLGLLPNGFQVLFADGSVRFLPATFAADQLKALLGRNDGILVNLD